MVQWVQTVHRVATLQLDENGEDGIELALDQEQLRHLGDQNGSSTSSTSTARVIDVATGEVVRLTVRPLQEEEEESTAIPISMMAMPAAAELLEESRARRELEDAMLDRHLMETTPGSRGQSWEDEREYLYISSLSFLNI
jgi:hypothetical protein